MTSHSEHSPNSSFSRCGRAAGAEPLPAFFETELLELAAWLAALASRLQAPPGLDRRIFEASVEHLPKPALRYPAGEATAKARWLSRLTQRSQWWGRLAMAASLALVFAITLRFVHQPFDTGQGPVVRGVVWVDTSYLEEELFAAEDDEVMNLLMLSDLSSRDEVTAELEAIIE